MPGAVQRVWTEWIVVEAIVRLEDDGFMGD